MATVLALDVGSSSVRAQRFDERAEPAGELRQERCDSDDAGQLAAAVRRVLDGCEPDGTSCFGHSLLALDRGGKPLTPILGWRDTRSAAAADRLRRRLDPGAVHVRTGAFLHPSFWPAKLAWLAETAPDVFREAARFVSFSDYVRGEAATSVSMASGTGLLDLATGAWDVELLDAIGLDAERLPAIADPPVWIDGACSNLGAGCTGSGRAALMIGTSGALRLLYETEQPQPRPGHFLSRLDARRVVEGGAVSDGGNLYAWLDRTLAPRPGELAGRDPDDHGLTFLPFLGGERSTGWDPDATGTVHGLTFATTPLDVRQAALEGVAFRFAAIAGLMPGIETIVATGGGLLDDPDWVQIMADALARPVTVSTVAEASLRGAAVASLERLGHEPAVAPTGDEFRPRRERADAYRSARDRHQRLYEVLHGDH
ncbi:MAG: gluconokinase [Gaiellaceae bacterium]